MMRIFAVAKVTANSCTFLMSTVIDARVGKELWPGA